MSLRGWTAVLRAGSALGVLVIACTEASAGGFAVREQSAYGQGVSFAGIAAGGALSSMFWNPATMTQYAGKTMEISGSVIAPYASHSYSSSFLSTAVGGAFPAYRNGVDNSGELALVPSTYASWQVLPQIWLGLSVNSPFGLAVNFPRAWAGGGYGQDAMVRSFNFTPSIAYKFNDMISVAAGVQVQYMTVNYTALISPLAPPNAAIISGDGFGYGFVVGATITPTPTTTIGIGYRSALDQDIEGSMSMSSVLPASTPGSVSTTLDLPDMLTVGLRQRIGDRFTLLAGFEWSGWSRIGTTRLLTPSGSSATIGGTAVNFPFEYSDGYMYSLGGEYIVDPRLTLRAGIAFEQSPITDGVRTPRLPDNDRMWYSVGATYKPPILRGVTFDLGYSFIDVKNTPIDISATSGNPWLNSTGTYIGSVDSQIHIFSLAFRYQWDAVAAPTPKLITK
jgi:long-chain fatty acid transport protein